jgi:7,8-dihydroneopterin aldolase/epimerase/oxygenase
MGRISIVDLEVFYCVGVPEEERARAQRLLLTVEMDYDFNSAAQSDRLDETIDYFSVAQQLLGFGEGRSWKLLEKLATDIGELVLSQYHPQSLRVEVKKFPIPQAAYVSVSLDRHGSKLESNSADG